MPTPSIILLTILVRVALLVVAIWAVRSRDPRLHVPAVLVFLLELGSLLLANLVVWDPRAYAVGSPGLLFWLVFGPIFVLLVLLDSVQFAPVLVLVAAAAALAAGFLIWRQLWRRSQRRAWTAVAGLGGMVAAIVALEISVESMMRWDAARIPKHRDFERTSAIEMVIKGASSFSARPHARLSNDVAHYKWSFRKGGWVRSPDCEPEDSAGCYAQDWR